MNEREERVRQTEGPDLSTLPCPQCENVGTLYIGTVLQAKPIGSFSLAGNQMKVSANAVPGIRCSSCSFVKPARRS
jgi:hypothetical protein